MRYILIACLLLAGCTVIPAEVKTPAGPQIRHLPDEFGRYKYDR